MSVARRQILNLLCLAFCISICLGGLAPAPVAAQCLLANRSFEIGGQGGAVFGAWNQFGVVGAVTEAVHGARAARVTGPDDGTWSVSGFWQAQDCQPGERWEITGHVRHPAGQPLAGQCAAIVNVEWRDAADALISYESFTVADAGSATDTYLPFALTSGPAPAGTGSARLLLGVLQSPTAPAPTVHYDQVTFHSTTPPTIDDRQWLDFPGGRTVALGGYTWRVKGPGYYGPGPNLFCDSAECVWVDAADRLHLTVRLDGAWYSSEVVLQEVLGYGDYVVTTVGRLDLLDPQVVLGLFLWQYGACYDEAYLWWNPYNEVDIEYSRWRDPNSDLGQFVAQPWDWAGNLERFDATFGAGEITSHAINWLPDRVEYRAWRGGPLDESAGNLIHAWTYSGPHIPRPEQPRFHLNLWKLPDGSPAADQEVVFADFRFVPAGAVTAVNDGPADAAPGAAAGRLYGAVPNPFNPATTLRFELDRDGPVDLGVYDLGGRRVRTLTSGLRTAGEHRVTWDGRDDVGRALAAGVYLFVLRGEGFVETRRAALLK